VCADDGVDVVAREAAVSVVVIVIIIIIIIVVVVVVVVVVQQQQQQQQQDITQLFNSLNGQGSTSQQQHSTLQSGPHGGNIFSAVQGQGNSQLLSALLSQNQAQPQIPYQQQQSSNQTGLQGQSMSHLLSTFGFQGQPQQQQQPQPQQYQQQSSQQVSGATQDQQQNLQQLLASMPPEALYNMLRESSRGEGRQ
jgi:hypothetical protein